MTPSNQQGRGYPLKEKTSSKMKNSKAHSRFFSHPKKVGSEIFKGESSIRL